MTAQETFSESDLRELLRQCYRENPALYARDELDVEWHPQQQQVVDALLEHRRVIVKAGNGPGKTHLAAGLVNWWFDLFRPGKCITTAPTKTQVEDVLWSAVRTQRRGRGGLFPRAPRMEDAPDHFAVGMTAANESAFQGRHESNLFIIFDEATGVDPEFWTAAEGMMTSENCYWLCLLNPTDTSSRAYMEEQTGNWHVISLSTLDHPNIRAGLEGLPGPVPGAVQYEWFLARLRDPEWCTPTHAADALATDVEWPPDSGQWYRPGPEFEARVLGRWPSAASMGVWSDALWEACLKPKEPKESDRVEIGCDVARFGSDMTEIVARRGPKVLHHEAHNGWSTSQTAGRLKELALELTGDRDTARKALIKVDDSGVGGGVTDQSGGYAFIGINSAAVAHDEDRYPNKRSELWFAAAQRAREGRIDVSELSVASQRRLKTQLMAPTWKLDSNGRRVVEPKDKTKDRIGRSPDSADAFNLCFYAAGDWGEAAAAMTKQDDRAPSPGTEPTRDQILSAQMGGASW